MSHHEEGAGLTSFVSLGERGLESARQAGGGGQRLRGGRGMVGRQVLPPSRVGQHVASATAAERSATTRPKERVSDFDQAEADRPHKEVR